MKLCANYPGPKEEAALSYVNARHQSYRESGTNDNSMLNNLIIRVESYRRVAA